MFHLPDDEEAYYDALSGFDIDDILARLFCWFCWIISPAKSGLSRYSWITPGKVTTNKAYNSVQRRSLPDSP